MKQKEYVAQVTFRMTASEEQSTLSKEDLQLAFRDELQEYGFDNGWLDGSFEIASLEVL